MKTKENKVHVEYVIRKPDEQAGRTMPLLEVMDPLAFVVVLWNFDSETLNALQRKLNEKFQYSEGEVVPLQIANSPYSFLLFKESITNTRPLGCVWSDRSGGQDGHETELIAEVDNFCNEMNIQRGLDPDNDDVKTEGFTTYSMFYNNECVPDQNGYYLITVDDNYEFVSNNEDDDGNWYIEIMLSEYKVCIGMHIIKEKCVPYNGN